MSAGVKVTLDGVSKLEQQLMRISNAATKKVSEEVARGALALQNEMRRMVQKGPSTGRVYQRGSVTHQASAPGEAPASDSGNLASHINHVFQNRFSADVGVFGVPYAHRLEFGGTDKLGRYIAPRPYLRPSLKKTGPATVARLSVAVKEALRVG